MTKLAENPAAGHQQHPLKVYLIVWFLLFVLSSFSYLVDYVHLQGALRWTLILLFMFLKAGFIISIFMHIAWERLALKLARATCDAIPQPGLDHRGCSS